MKKESFSDLSDLDEMKDHPVSEQIDGVFKNVIKEEKKAAPKTLSSSAPNPSDEIGLSFDGGGEFEISLEGDDEAPQELVLNGDLELNLSEESFDLGSTDQKENDNDEGIYGDLSLDSGEEIGLSLNEDSTKHELTLTDNFREEAGFSVDEGLSLSEFDLDASESTNLSTDDSLSATPEPQDNNNQLDTDLSLNFAINEADLSDDAKEKLKEIDAIMDYDATHINAVSKIMPEENLDKPLVSEDLDLGSLDFSQQEAEEEMVVAVSKEEKPRKKKKETTEVRESRDRDFGQDLKEISGAYSGEMERMQATISNLRADRVDLMSKIQKLEDEKLLQSRQTLSVRAELDEKKIELTIIRKKLNEEINDLKDRLKLYDEKRLIMEEKNRILMQELDKAAQKNKIDVKKVQMRERELEQKLELLKSDAETQIRNRDLKILELKRKIDSMEFDMESISLQEKRSVESRFELEDKLEKAIKTLRGAITVLEDESERSHALDTLKKNIDM